MMSLLSIPFAESETIQSARYYWDNAKRADVNGSVVQYTRSGEAFFEEEGQRHMVRSGQAMLFNHGEDSRYGYPPDATEAYELDFVYFEGSSQILNQIKAQAGPVVMLPAGSEAARLYFECKRRAEQQDFRDKYHESSLAYAFFMSLWRQAMSVPLEREPLKHAHELITERFYQPLTVGEIAQAVGVSREYLTRLYQEKFGISPSRHLTEARIQAANQLLRSTHAAIETIASRCGYRDADSFSRAYQRVTGERPTAFRNRLKVAI